MLRSTLVVNLLFFLCCFSCQLHDKANGNTSTTEQNPYNFSDQEVIPLSEEDSIINVEIPSVKNTIESRIETPAGYSRSIEPDNAFGRYLRNLPLKPEGSKVKYYDGTTKHGDVYIAVVDLPIGGKDLHQCADAVMRLRAEYLWNKKDYDDIHFNFTNGHRVAYSEWMKGNRMNIKGNKTWWTPQTEPSNTYQDFWEYLELIFMYAGTASLEKELTSKDIEEADIGDVLIKGGFPGHAVIIVDKAVHTVSGEAIYLLAQSYMPAQEIQVLKNYGQSDISPWYQFEEGDIFTPEWAFTREDLMHFVD